MIPGRIARATGRKRARRLGSALGAALLLTACTDAGSDEHVPRPKVSEREFDHRLTVHLSRFVSEVLDVDARASQPKSSRSMGCSKLPEGGPDWGVVPRAEVTVSAGKNAGKYLDDMQYWMFDNGFDDVEDGWSTTRDNVHTLTGVHKDGTQVLMEVPGEGPNLTITVTGPCTWPSGRPGGPPAGRLAPLPPPSGPSTDPDEACRSPKIDVYNVEARPFAGRDPHPMAVVDYSDEDSVGYTKVSLPDGWEPEVDPLRSDDSDEKKVQLVVCVRMEAGRDTGRNVTCSYSSNLLIPGRPHSFDVLEATYHVVVREARTGKKVKEFTVPGTQPDADSCPYEVDARTTKFARGIDEKEFQRKLRPLYTSPR